MSAKVTGAFEKLGRGIKIESDGSRAFRSENGKGKRYVMCYGDRLWRDHYVKEVVKLQQDTGAKIIYLDVFPLHPGFICYSKEHGHECPLWLDKAVSQVIQRLRNDLPPDVILWNEYMHTDVNSQYTDGNITYYYFSLHEFFAKNYNKSDKAELYAEIPFSLYRYIFPDIRQLGDSLVGPRYSLTLIPFFNGETELDFTYRFYNKRTLVTANKALAVRKKYADCFSTPNPEPLVPTEQTGIYANKFPGKNRTIWTVYNTQYWTYRGPVLATEHKKNAKYYDLMKDKNLSPQIVNGKAIISLSLNPQEVGCILQELE